MNTESISLGMIGCGLIARAHGIAATRSDKDIRFTTCSSRSAESAENFATEFGCASHYNDHQEMLRNESPSGLVIATPPDSHAQIIEDSIRAGIKAILCEKPLTANAREARTLRSLAKEADVTLLEGFMYRHHPQIPALLALIDSGELGTVDQLHCNVNMLDPSEIAAEASPPNWRRDAAVGGVLHDFLCYPIDIANRIMGTPPARVLARSFASPTYGTAYRVFGMLEYGDGAMASVTASRKSDFNQALGIGLTHGSIALETAFNPLGDTRINVQTSEGLIGQRHRSIDVAAPRCDSELLVELPVFTTQLDHFVGLMADDYPPIMSLDESVANALTRDAFIESCRSNAWCELN